MGNTSPFSTQRTASPAVPFFLFFTHSDLNSPFFLVGPYLLSPEELIPPYCLRALLKPNHLVLDEASFKNTPFGINEPTRNDTKLSMSFLY